MYLLDKAKFGALVAKLRKEKGYTQKELAEQLLISDKAISKWETGVTIPDTALLIPLADILGVTVTELLTGEQLDQQKISPQAVEDIVKTAIGYHKAPSMRAWQVKNPWSILFVLACLANTLLSFFLWQKGSLTPTLITNGVLTAVFGAYFWFFVPIRLPDYYDENKISHIYDGAFRMNVVGVYFNNSNWPHIIRACRWAMAANMVGFSLLSIVFNALIPTLWGSYGEIILFSLLLCGIFVPMYIAGRKYK